MIIKSRESKLITGKKGDEGRFVTLKSGRVVFIPAGKRSKWADVRDEIKGVKKEGRAEIDAWDVDRQTKRTLLGPINKEDIASAFTIPGLNTHMKVFGEYLGEEEGAILSITGHFEDPETGRRVGRFDREIYESPDEGRIWVGENLEFEPDFQNKGLVNAFYEKQMSLARRMGCDRMGVFANSTIGVYAWARKGYRYSPPERANLISREVFPRWAQGKGIKEPPGGWPKFSNPQDVANFRIKGVSFRGRDIVNKDVPADMELHVGKAFMLDEDGHRGWKAVLEL